MSSLKIGTDFSGLGSPEEALKRLGVEHDILFACEKDKYAAASYRANHTAQTFYDDVTTRDNSKTGYTDLYIFGFPCQAFSIAGKQLGFEDMRGTLVFNSADYIRKNKPRIFTGENVKGLIGHDNGRTFRTIIDTLAISENGAHNMFHKKDCLGYHVFYKVLNSKNYGIAQNRERIFIIGFRDEADAIKFNFPGKVRLLSCLRDYLQKDVPEKFYLNDINLQYLKRAKERDRLRVNINDGSGICTAITSNLHKGLHNGGETLVEEIKIKVVGNLPVGNEMRGRIYDVNGICPSILAKEGGGHQPIVYTEKRIRRLTPRECFRLQGYSDEFFEVCQAIQSDTQLYKQAGNSITVDTIMHLLRNVLKSIGIIV